MNDPRIDKLAELLVGYCVAIKPGDKVYLLGESGATPLLLATYRESLRAGGHTWLDVHLPDAQEIFYQNANNEQLAFVPEPSRYFMRDYDVRIRILAEENTKALNHIDPQKMVIRTRAFNEISELFLQRAARNELRWTVTQYPTNGYAQDADMSLAEYTDFLFTACLGDPSDPVGYWKKFSARQQKVVEWLKGKQTIHVLAPETDLTLSVAGRAFENCDGTKNMPDGEVFTGPVENSANGQVYFSYPAIVDGREVTGVRLEFKDGKCVKATADKNEDYLNKTLDTDEGARYLGEFAIGTNEFIQRFTRQILFDEKIGGSFHMALGAGYPETGSTNKSAIHWDMICDLRQGGEIWVDGVLLYKNGKFAIDF